MRRLLGIIVILGVIAAIAGWFLSAPRPLFAAGDKSLDEGGDVERGRQVFYAGGCASCHATPGQEDRLKLGGGVEMPSPFGSFYTPNISSHPTDGIGSWTVADLANAMMTGVSPGGSHYYPAFPYTSYAGMKVDDVRDLMTFLRTLAPVAGKARGHDLPFPFNIRRGLGLWKLLFFSPAPVVNDPGRTPEWNRGHYLVEALGHCAECHSPRNVLGAIVPAQRFAGGPDPDGKGRVPNITQSENGIKSWSKADISEVLATGLTPEADSVSGSMGSVVKNMSQITKPDRDAMAEYLKSLPAREGPPKATK
ncbi:cytochrome c [Roseiarcaceae bacterium H3SJ34-1]|uniref:c-type cytochrome n=1 Tax=Terripilifer ovatus TaxID=3032367 RepID=UPI003AB99914|nr:cytochrome c [Roseiarcaceae bacterium H3SJ34-1]